jgi:hypothetical protein
MNASHWYGVANAPMPENTKPLPRLLEVRIPSDCLRREHIEPALFEDLLKMDASPRYGVANGPSCTRTENSKPLSLPRHHLTALSFIAPRRFDVLFGKGKAFREHKGNVRANHLVAMDRAKYEQADKTEKTNIARRIVNIIHESHGRFLKFEESEGCWEEVDYGKAREKISHIFRNQKDRKRRKDRT